MMLSPTLRRTVVGLAVAAGLAAPAGAQALTSGQRAVYAHARTAWIHSQCIAAAGQSAAWRRIAGGLIASRPAPTPFAVAASELYQLADLPETGATKAQIATGKRDANGLNRFFRTPKPPRCRG